MTNVGALIVGLVLLFAMYGAGYFMGTTSPPDELILGEAECFQGWVSDAGVFIPLGWATLSDLYHPHKIYVCAEGAITLTTPARGAIMNLPRFENARDLIDANTKLIRENESMQAWIEQAQIQLEDLN